MPQTEKGLDYLSGNTKGRCWRCNIIWYWKTGKRRLKDTKCPDCGGILRPTAHYCRTATWKELPAS